MTIEREAEARIAALEAERKRLRKALFWYGKAACRMRMIPPRSGPCWRHRLMFDRGRRAIQALRTPGRTP